MPHLSQPIPLPRRFLVFAAAGATAAIIGATTIFRHKRGKKFKPKPEEQDEIKACESSFEDTICLKEKDAQLLLTTETETSSNNTSTVEELELPIAVVAYSCETSEEKYRSSMAVVANKTDQEPVVEMVPKSSQDTHHRKSRNDLIEEDLISVSQQYFYTLWPAVTCFRLITRRSSFAPCRASEKRLYMRACVITQCYFFLFQGFNVCYFFYNRPTRTWNSSWSTKSFPISA